jgi:hypothetical protein
MQILNRAKLTNRDITELKTAYEIELQREEVNDTASTLQDLADKIKNFWDADVVELRPDGKIFIDNQLSCTKWRQGAAGGGFVWYKPGTGNSKIIKGPWSF